jgi:hypothetical protein
MKHRTLSIAIAVLALLLLAGCDQVLEKFYPDFNKKFAQQQDAGITVTAKIDPSLVFSPPTGLNWSSSAIKVKLVPFYDQGQNQYYIDFGGVREVSFLKTDLDAAYSKQVPFLSLYNAMWAAVVFIDTNGNGAIDPNEPSILAKDQSDPTKEKADFRYSISNVAMTATLYSYSRVDPWILQQLQGGGGGMGGGTQAPIASIETWPATAATNQPVSLSAMSSYDPDPTGWVQEWIWTVYKDNYGVRTQEASYSFQNGNFTYNFTNTGSYVVSLKVKDNSNTMSVSPAEVWISVQGQGTFVSRRIDITGSRSATIAGQHTFFNLVNRQSMAWQLQIDSWSQTYSNSFFNVPDGEWFVIGWVDLNGNGVFDAATEPGKVATNTSQPTLTQTFPSTGAATYSYLNWVGISTVNVSLNIGNSDRLPVEFSSAPVAEAANMAPYRLAVSVTNGPTAMNGNLGGAGHAVQLTVYDPWKTAPGIFAYPSKPLLDAGNSLSIADLSGFNLSYHPGSGFRDLVDVIVDMNSNGVFGDTGDREATKEIFLGSAQTNATVNITDMDWFTK